MSDKMIPGADLRDLAGKIMELTGNHMAGSSAHRIVANACDHLRLLAGFEEQTHRLAELSASIRALKGKP